MFRKLRIGHINRRLIVALLSVSLFVCFMFRDRNLILPSKQLGFHLQNVSFNLTETVYSHNNAKMKIQEKTNARENLNFLKSGQLMNLTKRGAKQSSDLLKEQEKAKKYYKLGNTKTDHSNFSFLVDGSSICEEIAPFLLILVPSMPDHADIRQVIRDTWGQFVRNMSLPGKNKAKLIRLAFLLGKWRNNKTRHVLLQEKRKFGDIVVGDFVDSYKSLTRKILFGLKWALIYCGEADYILKIDEDIYINIPRLVDILTENPANLTGSIYGHRYGGGRVERKGKWAVSKEEFPLSFYPSYMSGNSYVISGTSAAKLLYTSQYLPYLPIEDAFITGVLPRITGISQIQIEGFSAWKQRAPDPCTFFGENKVSGNRVTPILMRKMWLTQNNLSHLCSNTRRDGLR